MAVKILIKRTVPDNREEELLPLLTQLRTICMRQPGYVSGETLRRLDKSGETLVISTWQSADEWREWVLGKERSEIQDKIDNLLGEKTEYKIYQF